MNIEQALKHYDDARATILRRIDRIREIVYDTINIHSENEHFEWVLPFPEKSIDYYVTFDILHHLGTINITFEHQDAYEELFDQELSVTIPLDIFTAEDDYGVALYYIRENKRAAKTNAVDKIVSTLQEINRNDALRACVLKLLDSIDNKESLSYSTIRSLASKEYDTIFGGLT